MPNVKIHPPLDSGHQPFKRLAQLGPGPKGRVIKAKEKYDCNKTAPYEQICTILTGSRQGKTFTVSTDPAVKQKYNKLYNDKRTRSAPRNEYRKGFTLKKNAKMTPAGLESSRRQGTQRWQSNTPGRTRRR